ncbi:MAG: hypothetical protein ACE5IQ_07015 [Candidatus Methylomirabilales bacterium]
MGSLEWMGALIVVGVVSFLRWCFDLIGLPRRGDTWWLDRLRKRRTKGEPTAQNEK